MESKWYFILKMVAYIIYFKVNSHFVRYPFIIRTLLKTFCSLCFFHKPSGCLVTRSQSWIVLTKRSQLLQWLSSKLCFKPSIHVRLDLISINFWFICKQFLKSITLIPKWLIILNKTPTFYYVFSFTHNSKTYFSQKIFYKPKLFLVKWIKF